MWNDLPTGDIRKFVAWVCNKAQSTYFPEYEQFVQLTNIKDRNLFYECQHVHAMYIGKWEWVAKEVGSLTSEDAHHFVIHD